MDSTPRVVRAATRSFVLRGFDETREACRPPRRSPGRPAPRARAAAPAAGVAGVRSCRGSPGCPCDRAAAAIAGRALRLLGDLVLEVGRSAPASSRIGRPRGPRRRRPRRSSASTTLAVGVRRRWSPGRSRWGYRADARRAAPRERRASVAGGRAGSRRAPRQRPRPRQGRRGRRRRRRTAIPAAASAPAREQAEEGLEELAGSRDPSQRRRHAQSASETAASGASEPVCVIAERVLASLRPGASTTTGLPEATTSLAARANSRPSRRSST